MYIKAFQSLLEDIGAKEIQSLSVCREPLSKAIMTLLDVASNQEFTKNLKKTPYDKLYHLFIELKIDNRIFVLEKNDTLSLTASDNTPRSETLKIVIPEGLTLGLMLVNTHKQMGTKFFKYKAQDNNCQYFAYNFLVANGLSDETNKLFIMQDVTSLFDKDTRFRKIVNSITGLGKNMSENKELNTAIEKFKTVEPIYNRLASSIKQGSIKLRDNVVNSNPFKKIKF